jgi:hypothetical protein
LFQKSFIPFIVQRSNRRIFIYGRDGKTPEGNKFNAIILNIEIKLEIKIKNH